MNTRFLNTVFLSALAGPTALIAADVANVRAPLHATAEGPEAGLVVAHLAEKKSVLDVSARRLLPLHSYAIEIGGVVEATTVTSAAGRIGVRFRTPSQKNLPMLDFDPRGKTLRILDGTQSVIEGVISGKGEDDGAVISEKVELEPGDDNPKGKATVVFGKSKSGASSMRVNIVNAGTGPFVVRVDGVERAETEHRGRRGEAEFESEVKHKGSHELEFEPRGSSIEILKDDKVAFSGKLEAQVPGVNMASPSITGVIIPSTGVDADGQAVARLKIDQRARKHFSVEVEDIPLGAYDLVVDGAVVGSISVVADGTGTKGELEFESGDDDASELPLDFDPVGKPIAIRQGATVYFAGTFDPNITGAGTPTTEPPSVTDENLASTGLDADAHADAKYVVDDRGRHKFSVEIEDVPAGSYTLRVAGVVRGTIKAVLVAGKVKGELEFEAGDDDANELPLNFDPRGQTIEISGTDGIYFTHLFGSGSAPATTPPGLTPFDIEIALLNSGQLPKAKATVELQQESTGGQSFEVEIEDAPVGPYELLVGGVVRGTVDVVDRSKGTRGRLKFENEVKAGVLLLDFPVIGQEVSIRQAGVVLFTRVFPNP